MTEADRWRSRGTEMGRDKDKSGKEKSSAAAAAATISCAEGVNVGVAGGADILRESKLLGIGSARGAARKLGKSRLNAEGYGLQPAASMVSSSASRDHGAVAPTAFREHDAAYFHAYSHIGVHEEMIKAFSPYLAFPFL